MTIYNHYEFKHIDDETTYQVSFNAELGSSVIDSFVQFMCGCGFARDFVIEYMADIVDEHNDTKKKLKELQENFLEA